MFNPPITFSRFALHAATLWAAAMLPASAADKTFTLSGGPVVLSDVTAHVGIRFTGMRYVPGQDVWLVDVSLTNKSTFAVPAPLVMWVESFFGTSGPIGPDGTEGSNPPHAYYDFTAQTPDGLLWPESKTGSRTLTLGYNEGAPNLVGRVYALASALPSGLTQVRTLNDAGQPLRAVSVVEVGPLGTRFKSSDPLFGLVTLGQTNGAHTWRFSLTDHLPVWRQRTLEPGEVAVTPSPRLTRRANGTTVPLAGGTVTNSSVRITVPPGAFAQNTVITPTPLTAQSLPGFLPLGWSPLQAFWLETAVQPLAPLGATIQLWGPVYGGESCALVRWNTNSVAWETVQLLPGPATNVSATLPQNGAFAIVVADGSPWPPPAALAGQPLPVANPPAIDYADLIAGGSVNPGFNVASPVPERVTGNATVVITNGAGALPSGLPLLCEIGEHYELQDGNVRRTPRYENFVVGYQRPGDTLANTLHTVFPMRPLLLLGPDDLALATIQAEVVPPGVSGQRVLGPGGGLASVGGISLRAVTGDFASREVLYLRPLDPDDLPLLSFSNNTAVAGFDLGVTGIAAGKRLVLQVAGIPTNSLFVLARVLAENGLFGLEPVERLASDAVGTLSSLEPTSGERLPGITGAGQYALVRVATPQGLITGVARNAAGQPAAGLPVRVEGQPWLTLSGSGGVFRLVSPAGAAQVTVTDPGTGDTGQTAVNIPAPDVPVNANLAAVASGPRVISITPTNGATSVARVTSVVVQFSEPIDPVTLSAGGIQLVGTNGQPVAASLTLNLQHTVATLLPVAQLPANALFTIRVAPTITDASGLPLEGANQFAFTTENDALIRLAAQVTSYEPTNGMAMMVGSPGTADPESSVILVNETTGQTATILSKPDGSFSNSIPADVDDFLSAVLVNKNGTENSIPVSRQMFRDGSVGLFKGGGVLEAESDGGPVQVIVEPGAIENKTRLWLEPISKPALMNLLQNTAPSNGVVLGGFHLAESGDPLSAAADVSFPIDSDDLGLPVGADPTEASFALTVPLTVDGGVVYQIVDTMAYEDGRLVTRSPPYLGTLVKIIMKGLETARLSSVFLGVPGGLDELGIPSLQGAAVRVLFVPILFSQGHSVTVAGKVVVRQVDENGNPTSDDEKPVAGALVRLNRLANLGLPGRLRVGELFAMSGDQGSFAFPVPIDSFEANTVTVFATHPRFPGQSAYSGAASVGSLYERFNRANTLILNLSFLLYPDTPEAVSDTTAPGISVSHTPRDPATGTNDGAGTVITVAARDDYKVTSVSLAKLSTENLNPSVTEDAAVLVALDTDVTLIGQTIAERRYRLTSRHQAWVRLQAQAADGNGNAREAETTILIAGDRIFPTPTDSVPGPTVRSTWPADGTTGVPPGNPLILRFSTAVQTNADETVDQWLQLSEGAITFAELSPDGRQVMARYRAPAGAEVTFTVQSTLLGANGRAFDQDLSANGDQSYSFSFTMAEAAEDTLAQLELGAGAVTKGVYALALDSMGTEDGSLNVYDLSQSSPTLATNFSLPGYPRGLGLIPQYSYATNEIAGCFTNDLLAVVGGRISTRGFQYLWIIDVTNPLQPRRVASAVVAASSVAVTRVKWSPPYVAYLETGSSVSSVGLVHLQKFIIGMNASSDEIASFPIDGRAGQDLNADGDYCDEGEELPLPQRTPLDFFGKDLTATVETTQQILDFDVDADAGMLGITLGSGLQYPGAPPTVPRVPPAYRTVFSGLADVDPDLATFAFDTSTEPKRVAVAAGVVFETDGVQFVRDLAVVSLRRVDANQHALAILDVSDPEAPELLNELDVSEFGIPQSLQRRSDGLLVLGTSTDGLLFDPALLALPANESGEIPALVGVIEGVGSGLNFSSPETGVNVVAGGGRTKVIRTGPKFRFVTFPNQAVFTASNLVNQSRSEKERILSEAITRTLLPKTRLFVQSDPDQAPVLNSPPHPDTHFFVRVDAVTRDRATLHLALQGLNGSGEPISFGSSNLPPATLASPETLAELGRPSTTTIGPPYLRILEAYRMSSDPGDPLYTVFLAGPIAITDTILSSNQVYEVRSELDRVIVRPARSLWVGLDPHVVDAGFSAPMLSRVSSGEILPGSSACVNVAHVDRPLVFVPGMAGSYLDNTNSTRFPTSITDRWLGWWLSYFQQELAWDPISDASAFPIAATDVVRGVPEFYSIKKIYGPFLEMLTNNAGYVEYDYRYDSSGTKRKYKDMPQVRTVDGADYDQIARQPNLFVFPYDWRQDIAETSVALSNYLELIKIIHPDTDKIDIVAHSMGGLVSRRFILDHPDTVDKLITIGTPWLGAPKAIAALETGDFEGLNRIISRRLLRELTEFTPGVHQLLPSKAYFDLGGRPMAEKNWDADQDGAELEAYSYDDYKHVVDDLFHPSPYSFPVARNESFHSTGQDDWRTDTSGVDYYHFYGVQRGVKTLGQVIATRRLRPVQASCNDLRLDLPWEPRTELDNPVLVASEIEDRSKGFVLETRFEYARTLGDGTVPALSASRAGSGIDLNAPNTRLFAIYSSSAEKDDEVEHNQILQNTNVQQMVVDILSGFDPQPPDPADNLAESYLVKVTGYKEGSAVLTDAAGEDNAAINLDLTSFDSDLVTALLAVGITKTCEAFTIGSELFEFCPAVTKVLSWVVEETLNDHTSEWQVFNTKPGNALHRLDFEADGKPYSVEVQHQIDGLTDQTYRWSSIPASSSPARLTLYWSSPAAVLQAGSSYAVVEPDASLSGDAARDEAPPMNEAELVGVSDGRLDIDDDLYLQFRVTDDLAAADETTLYIAYDRNEDDEFTNDVFHPIHPLTLGTTSSGSATEKVIAVPVPALESAPFALLSADGTGIPSKPKLAADPPTTDDPAPCDRITAEKSALLAAIIAGEVAVNASGWILPENPANPVPGGVLYILEQGSGACFWRGTDPCVECDGVFTPGSSDHDLEVFLPVYSAFSSGAPANFAQFPYWRANVEGDWYFKPPTTNAGRLVYTFPYGGQTNVTLTTANAGYTPANHIAEIFIQVVKQELLEAELTQAAESLTIFTARAEHFENGLLDLDRPAASGTDPVGDAGTGRQMLLLKWVLEGAYVPGYEGPSLDDVHVKLAAEGIPQLEGYEWAVYQEYAALNSGLLLCTTDPENLSASSVAHDFFAGVRQSQIKQAGKAAIRAALGRMVASGRWADIFIGRSGYQTAGYRSFEEYVAGQAIAGGGIPGINDAFLEDFARAKMSDDALLKELLADEVKRNEFLAQAVTFLRASQSATEAIYNNALPFLSVDERTSREANLAFVQAQLGPLRSEAALNLKVRLFNDGPHEAADVRIRMTTDAVTDVTTSLEANEIAEIRGDAATGQNFFLKRSTSAGAVPVQFLITSELSEWYTQNNWFAFWAYPLDLSTPSNIPTGLIGEPTGLPVPDESCRPDWISE